MSVASSYGDSSATKQSQEGMKQLRRSYQEAAKQLRRKHFMSFLRKQYLDGLVCAQLRLLLELLLQEVDGLLLLGPRARGLQTTSRARQPQGQFLCVTAAK